MEPGELIDGKYRVERLLGKGGMGAVYEGRHTLVDRRIAIKILFQDVTNAEGGPARFEREVRAAGRIGNDHILEVYDVGTLPDGARYMVSEFLDGEPLSERLSRAGPMPAEVVAAMVSQLLIGLGAAHQVGILHRDLKPDNIFLVREKAGQRDFVKIIDFGISKYQSSSAETDSMSMTATGVVIGTPYYLSPEQARGAREIDCRSDLYAVGVIMYECMTGRVPFHADSFNELLFKIALEAPPALEQVVPGVDPWFAALIRKAMAREPAQRFQSAAEMRTEILRWMGLSTGGRRDSRQLETTVLADEAVGVPTLERRAPTPSTFGRTSDPQRLGGDTGFDNLEKSQRARRLWLFVGVPAACVVAVSAWALLRSAPSATAEPGPQSSSSAVSSTSASRSTSGKAPAVAPAIPAGFEGARDSEPNVGPAPLVAPSPERAAQPTTVSGRPVQPYVPRTQLPATMARQRASARQATAENARVPERSPPPVASAPPPPPPPPPPAARPSPPARQDRDFGY